MNNYVIIPECGHWYERQATTAKTAYQLECSWFSPNRRVMVVDRATGQVAVFTRRLDGNGNLIEIIQEELI